MTHILRIDIEKPDDKRIQQVVSVLQNDGIIIYPTDSVYTMGCNIYSEKAFKKLCLLKGIKPEKAQFSIVCSDFSHLSDFSKQLNNSEFRILRNYLPGPFTFLLEGNKEATKIFQHNKKTIGFRIPDIALVKKIISDFGKPIFSASIQLENESPYATTAEEILEIYDDKVDLIIDGGLCGEIPTTIVALTSGSPEIIRQGKGIFEG